MSEVPRTYTPLPDATLERELNALVTIYRRAVERYEEANPAAGPSVRGVNDGTETKEASADGTSIHN